MLEALRRAGWPDGRPGRLARQNGSYGGSVATLTAIVRNALQLWPWLGGVVVLSGLIGWLGRAEGERFSWEVGASAGSALGTLALASVTWRLVASAREDAKGTLELARLARREQDARIIPFVYPIADRRWLDERAPERTTIAVRNGGAGLALNVSGRIYWPKDAAELTSVTLAGGDHATVHIGGQLPSWDDIWGHLFYIDLEGRQWETRFTYERRPDGRIRPQVCAWGVDLPVEGYPAGWEMPRGSPRIQLPRDPSAPR